MWCKFHIHLPMSKSKYYLAMHWYLWVGRSLQKLHNILLLCLSQIGQLTWITNAVLFICIRFDSLIEWTTMVTLLVFVIYHRMIFYTHAILLTMIGDKVINDTIQQWMQNYEWPFEWAQSIQNALWQKIMVNQSRESMLEGFHWKVRLEWTTLFQKSWKILTFFSKFSKGAIHQLAWDWLGNIKTFSQKGFFSQCKI